MDMSLTHLSHQIHLFHPQLHTVFPLRTCICLVISFLITLLSFRTAPWAAVVKLQLQLFGSFLLLNATQDLLLPLLKLTIYLFSSPPNYLVYIPKVRPCCFQFHLFGHTSSFHLICTSDSLSLTPIAKTELHASRQEPQRNSSPKWCNKPENTCSHTQTYILTSLQTSRLKIRPHFSMSSILCAYRIKLTIHIHNEIGSSCCIFIQSEETAINAEFSVSLDMFTWSHRESTRDTSCNFD